MALLHAHLILADVLALLSDLLVPAPRQVVEVPAVELVPRLEDRAALDLVLWSKPVNVETWRHVPGPVVMAHVFTELRCGIVARQHVSNLGVISTTPFT